MAEHTEQDKKSKKPEDYFFRIELCFPAACSVLFLDKTSAMELLEVLDNEQYAKIRIAIDGCISEFLFESSKMRYLRDEIEKKLLSEIPLDGVFK